MIDHVAVLESRYSRLLGMWLQLYESMKVAIVIAILLSCDKCEPEITSIHTMKDEVDKWRHVIAFLSEQWKYQPVN